MHQENDPQQKAAVTFLLLFAIMIAGYIVLLAHTTAHAQHLTVENVPMDTVDEVDEVHGAFDVDDPLHGIPGVKPVEDFIAGRVFSPVPPNPYMEKGFTEDSWKKHYEYEYYLWLEYRPISSVDLDLLNIEKSKVQIEIRNAVMQHLFHCIRRKDRTPALNPACKRARGGCEARINALAGYIVDTAYSLKIDPWLMAAVAMHESTFNPFAVGYAVNERGFMQINPKTPLGRRIRFVYSERYRRACRYKIGNCQREVAEGAGIHLYRDFKRCGNNLKQALTAYNTGRCLINGHIRRKYVNKVTKLLKTLKRGYRPTKWCDGIGNEKVIIMYESPAL